MKDKSKLDPLRRTELVKPDVAPPTEAGLSIGYIPVGDTDIHVEKACSSSIGHGIGRFDKTTSQGKRWLYSTNLLALRAARNQEEERSAKRLATIDKMIEREVKAITTG